MGIWDMPYSGKVWYCKRCNYEDSLLDTVYAEKEKAYDG